MTYEEAQKAALWMAKLTGHIVAAVYSPNGSEWRATSHADVLLVDIDVPSDEQRIDYCECLNGKAMSEWRILRMVQEVA